MKTNTASIPGKRIFGLAFGACLLAPAGFAATLTVEFKAAEGKPADYEEVNVYVLNTDTARSLDDAIKFNSREKSFAQTFEDLAPGGYVVLSFTGPFDEVDNASRPGAFRAQDRIALAGDDADEKVTIHYVPLDASPWIGSETAKGRAVDGRDRPIAGVEVGVIAMIETAGQYEIARAQTNEDGVFEFANLAAGQRYGVSDASGAVVGWIAAGDDISLRLPPQVGGPAPDFSFTHLESGETQKLSDFKGKVVLVEFWASWCGPCQEPMEKMQAYRDKYPDWKDKVEVIALSIDEKRGSAVEHLAKNGWNKTYNAWAGEGGFRAEAPQAYAVSGIPTACLIDREGKIAASGHPMAVDFPALIDGLLAEGQ